MGLVSHSGGHCVVRVPPSQVVPLMLFRFVSEKAAEEFIRFIGDEYELEVTLDAYLHVEVASSDFNGPDALTKLYEDAERFGAYVV